MLKSLHDDLVLWGKSQGEDSDDGDVQDKLTVPHELSAELKRVVEVSLVLVVELPLLQLLPFLSGELLWHVCSGRWL